MGKVTVMDHPLIRHKIGIIRREETNSAIFRQMVSEITTLIGYEATRDLDMYEKEIKTPLCKTTAEVLIDKHITIVPILRAGLGMLEGMLHLLPTASVGHIGLERDEETLVPREYYCKLPKNYEKMEAYIVDPMLATGGSGIAAIEKLKERGVKNIKFLSIIAAPEGIKAMQKAHPDIDIYVGCIDSHLNEHGYIVPGLGDAGDRIYATL